MVKTKFPRDLHSWEGQENLSCQIFHPNRFPQGHEVRQLDVYVSNFIEIVKNRFVRAD